MSELKHIYIRARNKDGKWGSYSLQEILDGGFGAEIVRWFNGKVYGLIALEEGAIVTEDNVHSMVAILDSLGVVVYKAKVKL